MSYEEQVYSSVFRRRLQWVLQSLNIPQETIEAVLTKYPQDPTETSVMACCDGTPNPSIPVSDEKGNSGPSSL